MYSNKTNTTQKSKGAYSNHVNFIEALKSTGSNLVTDTVKGIKNDVIKGTGQQIVDSLFNTNSSGNSQPDEKPDSPFNFSEFMHSSEQRTRAQDRVKYEYEQQETIIFNRRQEEVNKKIEEIKIELRRISETLGVIDNSVKTVIAQEEVNPGTYHLNFFERLLVFLQHMRKRVTEARNWAAMHQQRTQTKSYFWKQSNKKVSGTKFMLSQERQVATQTG